MNTTTPTSTIAGEYYLQGVMETASGFKLNEDSTFQFFFIYGAVDRLGEGTWHMEGDSVVLNSRKKPSNDFALVQSAAGEKDSIVIHTAPGHEMLSNYLYCKIKGGGIEQESAFENGTATFAAQPLDSITILFEFAPEKMSTFAVAQKDHHDFEIRAEQWLMEVFFENFHLKFAGDHLNGGHPMLNGSSFNYKKSGRE